MTPPIRSRLLFRVQVCFDNSVRAPRTGPSSGLLSGTAPDRGPDCPEETWGPTHSVASNGPWTTNRPKRAWGGRRVTLRTQAPGPPAPPCSEAPPRFAEDPGSGAANTALQ
jgi:hypothetical protein